MDAVTGDALADAVTLGWVGAVTLGAGIEGVPLKLHVRHAVALR